MGGKQHTTDFSINHRVGRERERDRRFSWKSLSTGYGAELGTLVSAWVSSSLPIERWQIVARFKENTGVSQTHARYLSCLGESVPHTGHRVAANRFLQFHNLVTDIPWNCTTNNDYDIIGLQLTLSIGNIGFPRWVAMPRIWRFWFVIAASAQIPGRTTSNSSCFSSFIDGAASRKTNFEGRNREAKYRITTTNLSVPLPSSISSVA